MQLCRGDLQNEVEQKQAEGTPGRTLGVMLTHLDLEL